MSYHIEKMMFVDLTDNEAEDLTNLATKIVRQGYVDLTHPAFVAWSSDYDER